MNVIMKSRMRERRTYGSVRGLWREPLVYSTVELRKSEFVERFPELSLFFKAYSLLDSEMICIFPYLCPYAESAREIREIFS